MLDSLLEAFGRGERLALSRLLTLVARDDQTEAILDRLKPPAVPSRVVAFTGAAGVGKSTLVGKLIEYLRKQDQSVAVLACDPRSSFSGGALLGDRFRMPSNPDERVFIRSLSAASGQGAIAKNLPALVRVLEAFGFDNILIETVGAGQGDTAVRDVADVVVLLMQPESGDDIQGEKAGLLEIVDLVAIHKADLPGVDRTESELRRGLEVSMGKTIPIVRVSGKTGLGIDSLWQETLKCPLRRAATCRDAMSLLRLAQDHLSTRYAAMEASGDLGLKNLAEKWQQGQVSRLDAIEEVWRIVKRADSPIEPRSR
jgi:LAO/AO transport system ATPase